MPPLSNLATRDVETLVHPYINLATFRESGPLVIERGQGVFVYDTDGKPYIEGMAGLWCTALDDERPALAEAGEIDVGVHQRFDVAGREIAERGHENPLAVALTWCATASVTE